MSAPSFPVSTANTTSSFSLATPSSNAVSWQSIFFGLAALALNAMTQRSYHDDFLPANSILFAMRSSPFICLADLIEVVIIAVYHFALRRRLHELPHDASMARSADVGILGTEKKGVHEESNTVAQGHPWVMLILFVGTSTQAVKIFGFEGLVWTKVWAASYVLSYVSVALLDTYLPRAERREPTVGRFRIRRSPIINLRTVLHFLALTAHAISFSWVSYQLFHIDISVLRQNPSPVGFWGYLIRFPIIAASAVGALLIFSPLWLLIIPPAWVFFRLDYILADLEHERRESRFQLFRDRIQLTARIWLYRIVMVLSMLVGMAIFLGSVMVYMDFRMHAADIIFQGMCLAFVVGVPCCIFFQYLISWDATPPGYDPLTPFDTPEPSHQAGLVTFAFMNFGIALLYFALRYDPEGTVKPAWTENLG